MAAHTRCFSLVLFALVACAATSALQPSLNEELTSNEVYSRTLPHSDSLLSDIMAQCFRGLNMEAMTCIRVRVLMYLDQLMGAGTGRQPQYRLSEMMDAPAAMPDAVPREEIKDEEQQVRSSDAKLDEMIASRVGRLMRTHVMRVQLPETFFQSATLTLKPSTLDLDVQFPSMHSSSRALDEARGILKKKLLLPVLLLLKLKLKALMPLLVIIASIKAVKALVISKIALLVVAGFVFLQLCKKLGGGAAMMPAMMMPADPMMMTPAPPASTYGAPAPPMPYSPPAPAPPTNSYGPSESSWEPAPAASSNSYSRVWDSHQLAYKGYYSPESSAQAQQGSSGSSAQQ